MTHLSQNYSDYWFEIHGDAQEWMVQIIPIADPEFDQELFIYPGNTGNGPPIPPGWDETSECSLEPHDPMAIDQAKAAMLALGFKPCPPWDDDAGAYVVAPPPPPSSQPTKKITTADCRNFLVTDPKVKQIVEDRSGHTDAANGDESWSDVQTQWVTDSKNPKKWKRQTKHKVGSKKASVVLDYGTPENAAFCKQQIGVDPTGGVIRTFWLEGTDHITIAILEVNGTLYLLDDLSD